MNYLVSTFRHQNIVLLFATPYSDFIDSQTKKLIHCVFDVRGHSRKTKKAQIRPKLLQYNSKMKKFYEHSLYVIDKGGYNKLSMMFIDAPPKHLIDPYEEKKTDFTTALNQDIQRQLDELALKNMPVVEVEEQPDNTHLLKAKWQDWFNYIKEHPNLKQQEYHKVLGTEGNGFKTFKQKCKKIGVNIEQYLGNRANIPNLEH